MNLCTKLRFVCLVIILPPFDKSTFPRAVKEHIHANASRATHTEGYKHRDVVQSRFQQKCSHSLSPRKEVIQYLNGSGYFKRKLLELIAHLLVRTVYAFDLRYPRLQLGLKALVDLGMVVGPKDDLVEFRSVCDIELVA